MFPGHGLSCRCVWIRVSRVSGCLLVASEGRGDRSAEKTLRVQGRFHEMFADAFRPDDYPAFARFVVVPMDQCAIVSACTSRSVHARGMAKRRGRRRSLARAPSTLRACYARWHVEQTINLTLRGIYNAFFLNVVPDASVVDYQKLQNEIEGDTKYPLSCSSNGRETNFGDRVARAVVSSFPSTSNPSKRFKHH